MLEAEGLARSHAGRAVLADVSFSVAEGRTVSVVGPSGTGKTTLLYLLSGLLAPDAGRVLLNGAPVTRPTGEISIILQDYGLLPWKNVLDNVALGLKVAGTGRAERNERARRELARLGLAGRERDYPRALSGGEQQRVAIARAFACEPRLMLMDEPFSSLDAITRERLQATLLSAWRAVGVPYVLVTHSVEEAVRLGSEVLLLAGSPATVRERFDNPGFGEPGCHESSEGFALARRIKGAMQEYIHERC